MLADVQPDARSEAEAVAVAEGPPPAEDQPDPRGEVEAAAEAEQPPLADVPPDARSEADAAAEAEQPPPDHIQPDARGDAEAAAEAEGHGSARTICQQFIQRPFARPGHRQGCQSVDHRRHLAELVQRAGIEVRHVDLASH